MSNTPWHWRNEGWKEAGFVCLLIFILMAFEQVLGEGRISSFFGEPIATVTQPIVRVIGAQQRNLRPFALWWHQADQIKQLTMMLADAESQLANLKSVKQENDQLRQLLENRHLELRERRIGQTIASYALPSVWLGKNTDVAVGSLVLYKNILLGRIASVKSGIGRVELLANSADFAVVVSTGDQKTGITKGESGQLKVEKLPPDVLVQPGQQVITVGQPGVPPGLLVGMTVSGVEYTGGQGSVLVNQLVTFYETSLVEILPL